MKGKGKIILTSIATMALSASLIVGGTFALFTSESEQNIVVTAGQVKVEANIVDLKLYSAKAADSTATNAFQDEKNQWYVHEYQGDNVLNFSMGGEADLTNGTLTLTNVVPGDKVEFDITIGNSSNVGILYRTVVTCEDGEELYTALDFGGAVDYSQYSSYKSGWTFIDANSGISTVTFSIAMPVKLGNTYQNKSCKIKFKVEAVQGNANVNMNPEFQEFESNEELV